NHRDTEDTEKTARNQRPVKCGGTWTAFYTSALSDFFLSSLCRLCLCGSSLRRSLVELLDLLLEVADPHRTAGDLAVAVDEEQARRRQDAVLGGELALLTAGLVQVDAGRVALAHQERPGLLRLDVEVDAQQLDTLVGLQDLPQLGEVAGALAAPGRPVVDDYDLALHLLDVGGDVRVAERRARELERLALALQAADGAGGLLGL